MRQHYPPVAPPRIRHNPDKVPGAIGESYRVSRRNITLGTDDLVGTSKQGGQLWFRNVTRFLIIQI